jgi:hypothetical protein
VYTGASSLSFDVSLQFTPRQLLLFLFIVILRSLHLCLLRLCSKLSLFDDFRNECFAGDLISLLRKGYSDSVCYVIYSLCLFLALDTMS